MRTARQCWLQNSGICCGGRRPFNLVSLQHNRQIHAVQPIICRVGACLQRPVSQIVCHNPASCWRKRSRCVHKRFNGVRDVIALCGYGDGTVNDAVTGEGIVVDFVVKCVCGAQRARTVHAKNRVVCGVAKFKIVMRPAAIPQRVIESLHRNVRREEISLRISRLEAVSV